MEFKIQQKSVGILHTCLHARGIIFMKLQKIKGGTKPFSMSNLDTFYEHQKFLYRIFQHKWILSSSCLAYFERILTFFLSFFHFGSFLHFKELSTMKARDNVYQLREAAPFILYSWLFLIYLCDLIINDEWE